MTRLILQSLRHYWRINLAVLLATAVGVATLTGSLLVGESVRGSLRALTLDRLGRIDCALVSDDYFREELAAAFPGACPAILLNGSLVHASSGARASRAQVIGAREDFWQFGDVKVDWSGLGEFDAVINDSLAHELRAAVGDELLLRAPKPSSIPRETFLGERDETVATLRLRVARVIPAAGLGRFGLRPSQHQPLNVYVPLATLQRRLEREGRVNAILAAGAQAALSAKLAAAFELGDLGVRLRRNESPAYLSFEIERVFLPPYLAAEALACAADLQTSAAPTLTYLVNTMRVGAGRGQRETPYSTVAAMADDTMGDNGILLNRWTADDLQARAGDAIALTYFVAGDSGGLTEATTTMTVAGVVEMTDPRVDRGLTPEFPGIAEAEKVAEWRAPFPLDLRRIRSQDEEYWDTWRATPKAFVSLKTGQRLWGNRYGELTSIRLSAITDERFAAGLRQRIDPAKAGLAFQPVREQGLAASKGASDFGGLFIGFSLFLLVSAAMMIRILFRLGVEGRAKEIGLLRAVGFPARRITHLLLVEGGAIAAVGGVLGLALAAGYGWLMVWGLRTWWVGAIGTPFLRLHVSPASLFEGFVGGWCVAYVSVWGAARKLARVPPRALLAGRVAGAIKGGRRRRAGVLVFGACIAVAALAVTVLAPTQSAQTQAALFFVAGALLLTAALAFFTLWLGADPGRRPESLTLTRLGLSGARRAPGRSLLVAGLVACATFLIVAVGANRQVASARAGKASGTGGFALLAESATPLFGNLDAETLDGATAYALRLRGGDDASCLNLYTAARPRILGVGGAFVRRGGFRFAGALHGGDNAARANPWLLLERPLPDGAIPAIGDYNTVMWLLHKGLGRDLVVDGATFRFVALLKSSVFQGELLISEANFNRLYPAESGWRFFAIDAAPAKDAAFSAGLPAALESQYEDFGLDVVSAPERLNALLAVENTYLSTFQTLGGLGLLLGTLGLALALLRNLVERRAELALMRALGYRLSQLVWLAVAENLLLLAVGLVAGAACALLAVAPGLVARSAQAPWGSLAATLLGVLVCGVCATALSAAAALRSPALRALREE